MTKLVAPDRGCIEADVGNTRYHGRILNVEDKSHETALREVGYFPASEGGVPRASGFVCTECGRKVWFATCGRCGSRAERP
jgi:hypothetical protein